MEQNTQKIREAKNDEIHHINSIIKNLNYLKLLYSKGVLQNDKDLFAISNALSSWEYRASSVQKNVDLIESGLTPESICSEALFLSKMVRNSIEKYEELTNKTHASVPNITEKEWLDAMDSLQRGYKANTFKENVFVNDDVMKHMKGYMVGPVGIFNNKGIEATTHQSFNTLDELKEWVTKTASQKDMVIYMTFEKNNGSSYHWRGTLV